MSLVVVIALLYCFLLGLDLLGNGAKVMSACRAGELFGSEGGSNPIASLMVGILSTVLLQSSSTTTSIIVTLVGASTIDVRQGIFMVMGANIGTSVTNTLVAIGQMGSTDQLEMAFAGATVHDLFNFMAVGIMLPIEVTVGYLERLTAAMTRRATVKDDEKWEGPVKKLVSPVGKRIIIPNKKVLKSMASGEIEQCSDFYPMHCDPAVDPPTYTSCGGDFGLISCNKKTPNDPCPAFFQGDATVTDDKVSGGVVFFMGVIIIFACLLGLVTILQRLMLGTSTHVLYKATNVNGYVAMMLGAGLTMVVQSSSITTSTLTPLVGIGALRLEQMYPLTLGANLGTTLTGIMAALVSDNIDALQVALAHLMFNVTGILMFYPLPFLRNIPLNLARKLGAITRLWRFFPFAYIAVMFVGMPLTFLALVSLFTKDSKGFTVLGSFIVVLMFLVFLYWAHWCKYMDGMQACTDCLQAREQHRATLQELPQDMEYIKETLAALLEHTGMPPIRGDDDKDQDDEEADEEDGDEEEGSEATPQPSITKPGFTVRDA